MPLVHIEHRVSRGSLRQWMFRLLPDLWVSDWKCWHEKLKQSFWTGGPEEHAERSCPLLRCWSWHFALIQDFSAGDTEAQEECDVGPHYRFWGVIKKEGKNKSPRFKSSFWDALPFSRSLSSSVGLSPRLSLPSLLSSSLGYGLNVFSLLGVQSLLIVRSSFLFANCSPWPSPLVPPPVLTCSTRRHARTFHFRACSEKHIEKCPELIN